LWKLCASELRARGPAVANSQQSHSNLCNAVGDLYV
jgi:hypothetical protein